MSKGRWLKPRKEISKYPKTEQQEKIAQAGKEIGEKCKGLKEGEFCLCRFQVLEKYFKKESSIKV